MTLFAKMKEKFGLPEHVAAEVEKLRKERRYNERQRLVGTDLVRLEISGRHYEIYDISYGGVTARIDDKSRGDLAIGGSHPGRLVIPGIDTEMTMEIVRHGTGSAGEEIAGISFHHESRDSLIVLREIIEPLRLGSTMVPVDEANLREEAKRFFMNRVVVHDRYNLRMQYEFIELCLVCGQPLTGLTRVQPSHHWTRLHTNRNTHM